LVVLILTTEELTFLARSEKVGRAPKKAAGWTGGGRGATVEGAGFSPSLKYSTALTLDSRSKPMTETTPTTAPKRAMPTAKENAERLFMS
jgi:hypothetical protein